MDEPVLKYIWHNPKFPVANKKHKAKKGKCVKIIYSKQEANEECQALRQENPSADWFVRECRDCNGWHVWRSRL